MKISGGRAAAFLVAAVSMMLYMMPCCAAAAPAGDGTVRALTPEDALGWKKIVNPLISPDGKWVVYYFSPLVGNSEVVVRATDGNREYRYPAGDAGSGMTQFSASGAWLAFETFPPYEKARELKKHKQEIRKGVTLLELATGEKTEYPEVKRFAFSELHDAAVALHHYGAPTPADDESREGESAPTGGALVVRDLDSGRDVTISNVAEFAFDKAGHSLAWAIAADKQVGNAVQVRNLKTGVVTTLDSSRSRYERLSWSEEGSALVFLRGVEDESDDSPRYSLVGISDVTRKPLRSVRYDPAEDVLFPEGMVISSDRTPQWTSNHKTLLFGITKRKTRDKSNDEEDKVDLVLWHWNDIRLQSEQRYREKVDRKASYLAGWRVADRKFIRLADEHLGEVKPPRKGHWALGLDETPYDLTDSLQGQRYQDVYMVNMETGMRKLAGKRLRWIYAQSPDGNKVLYYADRNFYVFDAPSGTSVNITNGIDVSFVDVENDRNISDPPALPLGWTADSRSVVLRDQWDFWKVSAAGESAINLTGNGRRQQIRYSFLPVYKDDNGIDLDKPQYLYMFGEWTKKGGVARLIPHRPELEVLVWEDAAYDLLLKARNAPTLIYQRSTSTVYPDLYAADATLANPRRLSDGREQLTNYAWSAGARLIDFHSDSPRAGFAGKRLQASLYLPAGYQPGQSYPTIVYIYERLSDRFHHFNHPDLDWKLDTALYTGNGYAVLMPDINYVVNDPGMSAMWCVLPALRAAIATGVVEASKVGLYGYSWGGYQTAFLVTQTDLFKAAVAGAPLTDLVSMYGLIYKNTGRSNMTHFESGQGRFSGGYWKYWDSFVRNSPVAYVDKITTPLLLVNNDKDGAVDFTQGLEYYNALRRLRKPVVMLQYEGENHVLKKPANRLDYAFRKQQFFDHYLRGKPAPGWWTDANSGPAKEKQGRLGVHTSPGKAAVQAPSIQPQGVLSGRIEELRDRAVTVRSLDLRDEDFTDLAPIKALIGSARVVALGEQTHQDGATFRAKARLVKFLHQEMGFDVLAWELGMFPCRVAGELLETDVPIEPLAANTSGPFGWGWNSETLDVYKYARKTYATQQPLTMAGFDCLLSGARQEYAERLFSFVDKVDPALIDKRTRALATDFILRSHHDREYANAPEALWRPVRDALLDIYETIEDHRVDFTAVHGAQEVEFWLRTVANRVVQERRMRLVDGRGRDAQANVRDERLAENLLYLVNRRYAGHKFILWAASSHLMDNSASLQHSSVAGRASPTMGTFVREALGSDYYVVGFVADSGTYGTVGGRSWPVESQPREALEGMLREAGFENAFLDLRSLPVNHWLRTEPISSRPLGHGPMREFWPSHFDAMFFTRKMTPTAILPRERKRAPILQ